MLSTNDIMELRTMLGKAFPDKSEQQVEMMVKDLVSKPCVTTTFAQMINNHITKVGVKQKFSDTCWGRYYYSTEYDNDMLDD